MIVDNYCNVYLCGGYTGIGDITIKYDSSGNILWSNTSGGMAARSIELDKYKNVYIAGYIAGIKTRYDYLTAKYSTTGVLQWMKRFNADTSVYSWYEGVSVAVDNIGNVYVGGYYSPYQGVADRFCSVKYTNTGELIWYKKDTSFIVSAIYMDIAVDKNSNLYVAGTYANPVNSFTLLKYDSSGTQIWLQSYSVRGSSNSLIVDDLFNVYLSGKGINRMCTVKYSQIVGIFNKNENLPLDFKMFQNYPNPFNPVTTIKYGIPQSVFVKISVYNILGQEVAILVNEYKEAGYYNVGFDGSNLASGIYIYKIFAINFTDTKKMLLLK